MALLIRIEHGFVHVFGALDPNELVRLLRRHPVFYATLMRLVHAVQLPTARWVLSKCNSTMQ